MAKINLLPWREELRKEQLKEFIIAMAVAAALMGVIVAGVHLQINQMISAQQGRNNMLQSVIKEVEEQIKEIEELEKSKEQLLSRMRVIEKLQSDRPLIVKRFDALVNITPDGLSFTDLSQKGMVVTIKGFAESNARVSSLMQALDRSLLYKNPKLIYIRNAKKSGGSAGGEGSREFQLVVSLATDSDDSTEE